MEYHKFKVRLDQNDKNLILPIKIGWDFLNRGNSIEKYESDILPEIINPETDFETKRFSFKGSEITKTTDINYSFKFRSNNNWLSNYNIAGFTNNEIKFNANSFSNSFFKLDLYDSPDIKGQKNYITIIIPTYESKIINGGVISDFKLNFIRNSEGYFIYWLKDRSYIDISEFYMSAKFFNAKIGRFVRFLTRPQNNTGSSSEFNFNSQNYFYYKIKLDYDNMNYEVYDISGDDELYVGYDTKPINWYEYVNP